MALLRGGGDAGCSWLLDDCGMGCCVSSSLVSLRSPVLTGSLQCWALDLLLCGRRGRVLWIKGRAEPRPMHAADVYSDVCFVFCHRPK